MLTAVDQLVQHDYLYYLDNVVTFDWLKQVMGQFPPEMQQELMRQLLPYTYTEGWNVNYGQMNYGGGYGSYPTDPYTGGGDVMPVDRCFGVNQRHRIGTPTKQIRSPAALVSRDRLH